MVDDLMHMLNGTAIMELAVSMRLQPVVREALALGKCLERFNFEIVESRGARMTPPKAVSGTESADVILILQDAFPVESL